MKTSMRADQDCYKNWIINFPDFFLRLSRTHETFLPDIVYQVCRAGGKNEEISKYWSGLDFSNDLQISPNF